MKQKTPATDRLLPHNIDTERLVLGAILFHNDALDRISESLSADNFYRLNHKTIYKAMVTLHEKGEAIDAVILTQHLNSTGELEDCGGTDYLIDLLGDTTTHANIVYHAKIVKNMARLRSLISATQEIQRRAYEIPAGVSEFLKEVDAEISKITISTAAAKPEKLGAIMERTIAENEDIAQDKTKSRGVLTGIKIIDDETGGLTPGQLVVIGGRPGMGKSALGFNIASHITSCGKAVLFFSLEMSKEELANRSTCTEAKLNSGKIKHPEWINDGEWERITAGYVKIRNYPLYIDDTAAITLNHFYATARAQRANGGLDAVVVDYLQLMNGFRGVKYINDNARVSAITKELKNLTKLLEVPIIVLSQLSRDGTKKERKPILTDLRESGSIEQDADIVVFLHRDNTENEEKEVLTKLILAKHRGGRTGEADVLFQKQFFSFL